MDFHEFLWVPMDFLVFPPCRRSAAAPAAKKRKSVKNISFIVFSPTNVSKMSVLSTLRSKNHVKPIASWRFWSKSWFFSENPYTKMQEIQKSKWNTIFHYEKLWHRAILIISLRFLQKCPRTLGTLGFYKISNFAVWACVFCVGSLSWNVCLA